MVLQEEGQEARPLLSEYQRVEGSKRPGAGARAWIKYVERAYFGGADQYATIEAPSTHTMGMGLKDMLMGADPLDDAEAIWELMLAEGEAFGAQMKSPEAMEAFMAFSQKRAPDFSKAG